MKMCVCVCVCVRLCVCVCACVFMCSLWHCWLVIERVVRCGAVMCLRVRAMCAGICVSASTSELEVLFLLWGGVGLRNCML